ncbi:uncharacterized protein PV09_06732 [Verruconis gallopava]|uniref:Ketoreductase (KR) domain-containing protein n=1 Tax=Verruconis gallopava TaxID=253628 RepID=A0A0D2A5S0_9PEZI|nr:uncharacterized protein PV09_06732 [Verruconis gallopava]KIW01885.1 hypothetical protein PV09_06732 [Verruconis gallopava]
MVSLDVVKASNATIKTELSPGLVAVFVGGTSGIGEISLKQLARLTVRPRIYIVGRSAAAAERILAECRALNGEGEYVFVQKTLVRMRDAEAVCEDIKQRERHVNVLFLSVGEVDMSVEKNADGLRPIFALTTFARYLIALRLLPLLQRAPGLRRIVDVAAGAHEDRLLTDDWQAERLTVRDRNKLRGHLATMKTLTWQRLVEQAPDVSIVQEFPGLVVTPLFQRLGGWLGVAFRLFVFLFGWLLAVPLDESAERHAFMATSAAFAPREGDAKGAPLVAGLGVRTGADGHLGSGMYSVGWNNEGPGEEAMALLRRYHEDGTAAALWTWMKGEFTRILGADWEGMSGC